MDRQRVDVGPAPAAFIRVKVISIGAPCTGKSCLIKRFCEKRFVAKYRPTVGIDFGVAPFASRAQRARINFFDLSGAPEFAEVRAEFYAETQGVLLAFDVTRRDTFDVLGPWLAELKAGGCPARALVTVCGNKADEAERAVGAGEAQLWAEQAGCVYFETSASTGLNVDEAFHTLFDNALMFAAAGKVQAVRPSFDEADLQLIERINKCTTNHARLGVPETASKDDVNRAFKQLATRIHPDKNRAPGSDAAFRALLSARTSLLRE